MNGEAGESVGGWHVHGDIYGIHSATVVDLHLTFILGDRTVPSAWGNVYTALSWQPSREQAQRLTEKGQNQRGFLTLAGGNHFKKLQVLGPFKKEWDTKLVNTCV